MAREGVEKLRVIRELINLHTVPIDVNGEELLPVRRKGYFLVLIVVHVVKETKSRLRERGGGGGGRLENFEDEKEREHTKSNGQQQTAQANHRSKRDRYSVDFKSITGTDRHIACAHLEYRMSWGANPCLTVAC